MILFDTHCHLDFKFFDADRAAMLDRARSAGVRHFVIPGVDSTSIQRAQQLAQSEPDVRIALGIHPNSTAQWEASLVEQLRQWAVDYRAVAIGEIGLDYHWDKSPKATQHRAFEDQLALASELVLPVIIHNREASADTLPILEEWAKSAPAALQGRLGVLHSFSDAPDYAERALAAGFYLGFAGPLTYKNADILRQIAARVPDDRLLIETDCPFLTPHPHRGQRNEPAYVALVLERLATLRGSTLAEMAAITTANGLRLFGMEEMPNG